MDPLILTGINRLRKNRVAILYRDTGRTHLSDLVHPSILSEQAVLPRILAFPLRQDDMVFLQPRSVAHRLGKAVQPDGR